MALHKTAPAPPFAVSWEGKVLQVGASLGVAALSETHETAAEWLAEADAACYEAKHAGRDAVRVAAGGQQLRLVEGWRD